VGAGAGDEAGAVAVFAAGTGRALVFDVDSLIGVPCPPRTAMMAFADVSTSGDIMVTIFV